MQNTSLSFWQILERLRDGNGYRFGSKHHNGYFYKAPFPPQDAHTQRDGAISAITFWRDGIRAMPTLMLYDFDDDNEDWYIIQSNTPE